MKSKLLVNVLIPMAGVGQRFRDAGYTTPKPLINVGDRTMVECALSSFSEQAHFDYYFIFVILSGHDNKYDLSDKLFQLFGNNIIVIILDHPTRGQAETCLAADRYVNNDQPLIIYNCDTYSDVTLYPLITQKDPDGIIPYFEANDPRYSFVAVNKDGLATEVAEKQAVSNRASTGMYYFKQGKDFIRSAKQAIDDNDLHSNEFYVAPCYNSLIKEGKIILTQRVKSYDVFGTPEELDRYTNNHA